MAHKTTLAQDLEYLKNDGCLIKMYAQFPNGHVVLWGDRTGYSVSSREYGSAIHVGSAQSWEAAKSEYLTRCSEFIANG